jgi:hypothetical protein
VSDQGRSARVEVTTSSRNVPDTAPRAVAAARFGALIQRPIGVLAVRTSDARTLLGVA